MWVGFFLLLYQTQTPNPSPLVFKPDFGVIKCEFVVKFCVKVYGIINVKGMENYYPLRLCKSSIMYIVDCYNYSGNVVGYKM